MVCSPWSTDFLYFWWTSTNFLRCYIFSGCLFCANNNKSVIGDEFMFYCCEKDLLMSCSLLTFFSFLGVIGQRQADWVVFTWNKNFDCWEHLRTTRVARESTRLYPISAREELRHQFTWNEAEFRYVLIEELGDVNKKSTCILVRLPIQSFNPQSYQK